MASPAADFSKTGSGDAAIPMVSCTISEIREIIAGIRSNPEAVVGLVPTMGFFHQGHLSLMRAARRDCSFVVVSIFVNPAQFGPDEDLNTYPRDLDTDLKLAGREDVNLAFVPTVEAIYPDGYDTYVEPGAIAQGLCGQNRPGHFRGVATVVAKLFNIIQPDRAYFGQKDAQQAAVIRRMTADLDFDVEVIVRPIVRDVDGVALSSRNSYLTEEERAQAPVLFQALKAAEQAVAEGERDAVKIRRLMRRTIGQNYLVEMEYARIVNPETMESVPVVDRQALAAVAARIGKTRLIDNLLISP